MQVWRDSGASMPSRDFARPRGGRGLGVGLDAQGGETLGGDHQQHTATIGFGAPQGVQRRVRLAGAVDHLLAGQVAGEERAHDLRRGAAAQRAGQRQQVAVRPLRRGGEQDRLGVGELDHRMVPFGLAGTVPAYHPEPRSSSGTRQPAGLDHRASSHSSDRLDVQALCGSDDRSSQRTAARPQAALRGPVSSGTLSPGLVAERREEDVAHPGGMPQPGIGDCPQLPSLDLHEFRKGARRCEFLRPRRAVFHKPFREVGQLLAECSGDAEALGRDLRAAGRLAPPSP